MICSAIPCDEGAMTNSHLDSDYKRLAWAREHAGYKDAAEFARVVGIKPVTYRAYESGQNGFSKYAPSFGKKLGVSGDWLLKGGPTPSTLMLIQAKNFVSKPNPAAPHVREIGGEDGAVKLRLLDLDLSMGDGSNIDDYVEEGVIDFDAGLLRRLTRTPAERLFVARGSGDSMFPTLVNGDMVLIDPLQRTLNLQDRIWAISLYGAGGIKRLQPVGQGRVEVISDNSLRDNRVVDAEDLRILGRVIWIGREV